MCKTLNFTEFELRQWTDLRVEALAFNPWARRVVATNSNHAVESGGSDPASGESGGGVADQWRIWGRRPDRGWAAAIHDRRKIRNQRQKYPNIVDLYKTFPNSKSLYPIQKVSAINSMVTKILDLTELDGT
jgi:hypothetical protein